MKKIMFICSFLAMLTFAPNLQAQGWTRHCAAKGMVARPIADCRGHRVHRTVKCAYSKRALRRLKFLREKAGCTFEGPMGGGVDGAVYCCPYA